MRPSRSRPIYIPTAPVIVGTHWSGPAPVSIAPGGADIASEVGSTVNEVPAPARSMPASPSPRAFSMRECAHALGVSERTVQTLVSRGTLRSVRAGTRRLIPRDALDEYLTAGTPATATPNAS